MDRVVLEYCRRLYDCPHFVDDLVKLDVTENPLDTKIRVTTTAEKNIILILVFIFKCEMQTVIGSKEIKRHRS